MMSMIAVLLLTCSLLAVSGTSQRRSGPFNVILEKIEKCDDPGTNETFFPTKLIKVSRNKAVLNDSFSFSPGFDKNTKWAVELQQWGNQGYRPRAFQYTYRSCNQIWKFYGPIIQKVFASAGVNITGCPIPAGIYTAQNLELDLSAAQFSVMTYNKFRAIGNCFYKNKKVGCLRGYVEVVPKE